MQCHFCLQKQFATQLSRLELSEAAAFEVCSLLRCIILQKRQFWYFAVYLKSLRETECTEKVYMRDPLCEFFRSICQ